MASGSLATSRPRTRISPWSGTTNPSNALSIVLLPAPFGPSRPTAPAAKPVLTSRKAVLRPYVTVTRSSVTTGAVSAIPFAIRRHGPERSASQSSAQSQRIRPFAHEADDVGDVLLERQAEQLGAGDEI